MPLFQNPYRPGAGHTPPYLAGRESHKSEFVTLLANIPVTDNVILTGLRGTGKTVLLEEFQKMAVGEGWLWAGSDLSEASASQTEERFAVRMMTDLAVITTSVVVNETERQRVGFTHGMDKSVQYLDYSSLCEIYNRAPGLVIDKLKAVLQTAWNCLKTAESHCGIIFAYDEAQNLADNAARDEYPLALLLDAFQSLQRAGFPLLLVLTGLPVLFPKLVEARTYAERMFNVIELGPLNRAASRDAIIKPQEQDDCPVRFTEESIESILDEAKGYPYFIQFICREVFNIWGEDVNVSVAIAPIIAKLDTQFFAGRWERATDRQRDLMGIIAGLDTADVEFSAQEIVAASKNMESVKSFSTSHVTQILNKLMEKGLVYRNRHGKYMFSVPLLAGFIRRNLGD